MKIVLVNVRYSPNLGDGVIADCLEKALIDRLPGVEIVTCDLAGRADYAPGHGRARGAVLKFLGLLPDAIRKKLARLIFEAVARLRLMSFYRVRLANADLAIFGGGQLLSDADYNFPVKIAAAAAVARALRLKFAMYSLGVGQEWSIEGGALFREAFVNADLVWASVRDKASLARWERHFAGAELATPEISIDPGVIAAEVYPAADTALLPGARRRIGLCVAAPLTLDLHTDQEIAYEMSKAALYSEIARLLIESGFDVTAFTNGAPDDEAFLKRIFNAKQRAALSAERIEIAPRPLRPGDLVGLVRRCDGIIAHRLHANIIAYGLRIPHVGLGWDSKVEGFFREVGRERFVIPAAEVSALRAVETLRGALDAGIDEQSHRAVIRRANQDLDSLAVAIGDALGIGSKDVIRRASSASVAEIHPSASARLGPIAS